MILEEKLKYKMNKICTKCRKEKNENEFITEMLKERKEKVAVVSVQKITENHIMMDIERKRLNIL